MPAPDDVYTNEVDFRALSLQYPDFAKRLKSNRQLDFTDPESFRQLTKALLHRDFGLSITLPEDRLCPPVPNRFNYVLFLQRLLDSTQEGYDTKVDANRRVVGLDIGTGASAIYPLLACRQRPQWYFLATEIDSDSKTFAEGNVEANGLQKRIKVVKPDAGRLIPASHVESLDKVDFIMTNPPFYTSQAELESLAKQKSRPPNSACTGAPVEMVCLGGEVGFVDQLLTESCLSPYRQKIQWFSSMLGKLGSANIVIDKLRRMGCSNFAVTEFVQGQKTRRWCVAWSWQSLRPPQAIARGTDAVEKKYFPFPAELEIVLGEDNGDFLNTLTEVLQNVTGLDWAWRPDLQAGLVRSMEGDVWSRSARRRQKKQVVDQIDNMQIQEDESVGSQDEPPRPKLVVKITSKHKAVSGSTVGNTFLNLRWMEGFDNVLFESFHGWLKRKLLSRNPDPPAHTFQY